MHFNWLHLTDLHRGMDHQDWLWQNVRERLFEDLAFLHPLSATATLAGGCGALKRNARSAALCRAPYPPYDGRFL